MANTTHVNYDGLFESSASVRCASCKHEFKFQSFVSGFCPACGKEIVGMKADNVPMQYVPKGYKAYLFNKYEEYHDYYYRDKDHWNEVVRYESIVYTIKHMIEDKESGWVTDEVRDWIYKRFEHGWSKSILEGWAYVRGYEPIEVINGEKKGVRLVYETKNEAVKTYSLDDFCADVVYNYNKHIAVIEKNCNYGW